mgnify:CR=1 FL=1
MFAKIIKIFGTAKRLDYKSLETIPNESRRHPEQIPKNRYFSNNNSLQLTLFQYFCVLLYLQKYRTIYKDNKNIVVK